MYKEINFFEFQKLFSTERKCENYLFKKRWANGFVCPRCRNKKYYRLPKRKLYQCKKCGYQSSLTSNTVFHKTRTSLRKWFWAIYLITTNKNGISALQIQKQLSIKSYQTAWTMLHKIRNAMIKRNQRYKLTGLIELDEAYLGQKKQTGKRGRGSENKSKVLAAIEVPNNNNPRFAFLKKVEDISSSKILDEISQSIKEHQVIKTDGYSSYKPLSSSGYYHYPKVMKNVEDIKKHLPWVHILISNLKSSIRAVFHGVSKKHLQRYLDEYSYRFNRRFVENQLFDRLLVACISYNTVSFSELTG